MKDRSFFGVILILLGLGFLLDQFNVISFGNILSLYWPIILIIIGLAGLFNKKSSKVVNAGLVALGLLFQAKNLEIIDINIFKLFWPVILIIAGINIISDKNRGHSDNMKKNTNEEEYMDEFVVMSGIETTIVSQDFKGGKARAVMGGIEIDLRGAQLHNNQATIEITSIMGGVEIFVPENWKVEHSGTPLLGGFTNKSRQILQVDSPLLKINFTIIMGGIEIK